MVKNMCYLWGGHKFKTGRVGMLILARCDKAGRVDDPWDRGSLRWDWDVSTPAESQVIGISGKQECHMFK